MKCRLDKLLSSNGFGSRRDIKRLLKTCVLQVNTTVETDPSTIVDSDSDVFILDGSPLVLRTYHYIMLNKSQGVVTSTDDPEHRTVIDLLGDPWCSMNLFPVGRLDRDTEGLLILTNDGPLTHALTSPKRGVDKKYYARLRDSVDAVLFKEYAERFSAGVTFHDGYTTLPAVLERAGDEPNGMFLVIQEGKNHQVKKMFKVVGNEVVFLKRVSMGSLHLDQNLAPGEYRELTSAEIEILRLDVGGTK